VTGRVSDLRLIQVIRGPAPAAGLVTMVDVLVRYRILGAADAAAGLAITALSLLAARARTRLDAIEPGNGADGP